MASAKAATVLLLDMMAGAFMEDVKKVQGNDRK